MSSSITDRANLIKNMIAHFVKRDFSVWLFVEHLASTESYGQLLQSQIIDESTEKHIPSEQIVIFSATSQEQQLCKLPFHNPNAIIFLLGLAEDFKKVVQKKYPIGTHNKARIIGIMNSHLLENMLNSGNYATSLIFDIVDIDFRLKENHTPYYSKAFSQKFNTPSPTNRDEAYSFDLALLINTVLTKKKYNTNHFEDAKQLIINLSKASYSGISGEISAMFP